MAPQPLQLLLASLAALAAAPHGCAGIRIRRRRGGPAALRESPENASAISSSSYLVFLEVYPVGGPAVHGDVRLGQEHIEEPIEGDGNASDAGRMAEPVRLHHSDLLLCPSAQFAERDQMDLAERLGIHQFAPVEASWWQQRAASCELLTYGESSWRESCSGLRRRPQKLADRASPVHHAMPDKGEKFFYGVGLLSGKELQEVMCEGSCGARWSGANYNAAWNNGNTMAATALECVLGLWGRLPDVLGLSGGGGPRCTACKRHA